MVDKVGRALVFITAACGMLICAHFYFLALAYGWINASPVPAMLWLGVTYSMGASCLWPILAFIVEKDALGTAYGCMTSVQNLFLALAALVIGQMQDWAKSAHPGVLQYTSGTQQQGDE
jgi:MFS family permease